jgi:hypothetical protein
LSPECSSNNGRFWIRAISYQLSAKSKKRKLTER